MPQSTNRLMAIWLPLSATCFFNILGFALSGDGHAEMPSVQEVLDDGRPANLFKLTYQSHEGSCNDLSKELNTPNKPQSNRGDYFSILTATDSNAAWTLVQGKADLSALYVEEARADIFNRGTSHIVFRVHGSLGGREFDVLYADPDGAEKDVAATLQIVAPHGRFDDRFAIPSAKVQEYYGLVEGGSVENRGLPRFDILRVNGITYIAEASFYEFAPFDAVLTYRARPDQTFDLECAFDPQTKIPLQP